MTVNEMIEILSGLDGQMEVIILETEEETDDIQIGTSFRPTGKRHLKKKVVEIYG
jgi:hypothetical protein